MIKHKNLSSLTIEIFRGSRDKPVAKRLSLYCTGKESKMRATFIKIKNQTTLPLHKERVKGNRVYRKQKTVHYKELTIQT